MDSLVALPRVPQDVRQLPRDEVRVQVEEWSSEHGASKVKHHHLDAIHQKNPDAIPASDAQISTHETSHGRCLVHQLAMKQGRVFRFP